MKNQSSPPIVLVTGAGRGIGRGIAEELAAQGAKVACAARSIDELKELAQSIKDAGGEAMAVAIDMGDMGALDSALETVVNAYGRLDILVNNAGMNARQPIDEVTEENYDRIMNVNLKGLYFLSQKAARYMAKNGAGKIINLSLIHI